MKINHFNAFRLAGKIVSITQKDNIYVVTVKLLATHLNIYFDDASKIATYHTGSFVVVDGEFENYSNEENVLATRLKGLQIEPAPFGYASKTAEFSLVGRVIHTKQITHSIYRLIAQVIDRKTGNPSLFELTVPDHIINSLSPLPGDKFIFSGYAFSMHFSRKGDNYLLGEPELIVSSIVSDCEPDFDDECSQSATELVYTARHE